jgi:hypothetical protein
MLQTSLAASAAGTLFLNTSAMSNLSSAENPHYYELCSYETRNDLQPARLNEFIEKHWLAALKRQGITNVAALRGQTGLTTPGLLLVTEYKSLAVMQSTHEKLATDKEYQQALQKLEGGGELPYVRIETTLLRAFAGHPAMEFPAPLTDKDGKPVARLFELRTYESRTTVSLKNKIEMFNQEEIKIFRDCGFAPAFFGEVIAGSRMPALTYLVGFDNMEHRDKCWAKFVASPDFNRIKVKPGWTDPEAVSNIHGAFVQPLPFSKVR